MMSSSSQRSRLAGLLGLLSFTMPGCAHIEPAARARLEPAVAGANIDGRIVGP